MAHIDFCDVSQWQGNIDWGAYPYPIVVMKMSGGDGPNGSLYTDSKANANYYGAKAAGKAIGMYHFAGGGDPVNEADFFVAACSPLEENDVMVLDWEIPHNDPVGWCWAFVSRVHERTGVWPLVYMNGSIRKAYDWGPVAANCGMWIAWWGMDPEGNLPVPGIYVAHQYSNQGQVPGIAGRVDLDAWFGTVDQFKKYGYHAAAPPPPPTTTTTTPPPPPPLTTTTTTATPAPEPPVTTTTTTQSQGGSPIDFVVALIRPLWLFLVAIFKRLKGESNG